MRCWAGSSWREWLLFLPRCASISRHDLLRLPEKPPPSSSLSFAITARSLRSTRPKDPRARLAAPPRTHPVEAAHPRLLPAPAPPRRWLPPGTHRAPTESDLLEVLDAGLRLESFA